MHPADIKALIAKAGSSQTAIARSLKGRAGPMRVATVHAVVTGHAKSQRVAAAVSKLTGRPVKDLWPGKYPDLEKHQAIEANLARKQAAAAAGAGARSSTTSTTTPTKKAA